ncbi:hypothetical protein [Nocardia amamiensis]|uniref:hypothetical protein n=1 Tax=Nocardia amamiensis TaxID=404578 RepID=UPI000AFA44DE|nr:hypothetical protein [Nocardia amamiensis]
MRVSTTSTRNLTLLGRYYERFADHTVQVGRRIRRIPGALVVWLDVQDILEVSDLVGHLL